MFVHDVMVQLFPKACPSISAARRLIKQNAVKVDGLTVEDEKAFVTLCNAGNHKVIAVLEGSAREHLLRGGFVNVDLEESVEEDNLVVPISVGKHNRGIIKFTI